MSHDMEHDVGGGGILANKLLWICMGVTAFVIVGWLIPTPQSVIEVVEKYGFAKKMIGWGVAETAADAAQKTMIVLGMRHFQEIRQHKYDYPIQFRCLYCLHRG